MHTRRGLAQGSSVAPDAAADAFGAGTAVLTIDARARVWRQNETKTSVQARVTKLEKNIVRWTISISVKMYGNGYFLSISKCIALFHHKSQYIKNVLLFAKAFVLKMENRKGGGTVTQTQPHTHTHTYTETHQSHSGRR